MKVQFVLLFAVVCSTPLLSLALEPSDLVSVKLTKKPLEVQRVIQQREILHKKYALGSANKGEDVPLLDFMDAQVSPANTSMKISFSILLQRAKSSS